MKNKIKVAIVVNDFLVGGVQRLFIDILARFDHDRFEVSIVTLFTFEDRITLYDLVPKQVQIHKHDFKSSRDIKEWLSLIKTIKKIKPDVVISNLFLSNLVIRVLKPFFGYKCIASEHNTYIYKTRMQIFWDFLLSKITFSIVAVSNSVKEFTAQQENISLSKFSVIYNGIDIDVIEKKLLLYNKNEILKELGSDRKYIISVARLSPQKNHKLLIDGFSDFTKKNTTHDLLVVGGGGLMETLRNQAQSLGILDRIHFLGNQMDVYRYYAVSDFFVSTSTIEGFGIAHAEALACGLPLLSTKTAGPDEMITEGVNGFFITDDTSDDVSSGMIKMLENINILKTNTKSTALRYDISATVKSYEQLINRALLS